tara:strand:+ start:672 stop:1286 length:615 start_codon:yes stop_codon:yes gene_type:complete
MKLSIVTIILLSCVNAQRVQLFTKSNDIFTSSNQFDVKNREVVFMEEDIVLMTVPIKNLIEVRYAEKSYKYIGSPCVFLGSLILASTAGLGAAGQIKTAYFDTEELMIGIGSGISFYFFGKLLKTIGVRFGKDVIYEDFDRLTESTKTLILESISLDMQKKEKEGKFMPGPEGRVEGVKISWEGKKPWKTKYKPKKKIVRFSFF